MRLLLFSGACLGFGIWAGSVIGPLLRPKPSAADIIYIRLDQATGKKGHAPPNRKDCISYVSGTLCSHPVKKA
jgi:hypothetical protein